MALNKKDIKDNFEDIINDFIAQHVDISKEKYTFHVSKKGKLLIKNKASGVEYPYLVSFNTNGNYRFLSVSTPLETKDDDNFKQEIIDTKVKFENILNSLSDKYYFYITEKMTIVKFNINHGTNQIIIKINQNKNFSFNFQLKTYKTISTCSEGRISWLLNIFNKELEEKIKNNIIEKTIDYANKNLLKKDYYNLFGKKIILIQEFINKTEPRYRNLVIGTSQNSKITSLNTTIYNNKIIATYDEKNNIFIVSMGHCVYHLNAADYSIIKEEKNTKLIQKLKKDIANVTAPFSYYEYILSFLDKLEKLDCEIITGKDAEKIKIPADYKDNGICYNNTRIVLSYRNSLFPVLISIPHLQKEDNNISQLKKDAKPILDNIIKEVKSKIAKIEEAEIQKCRNNKIIYQSFAAKTICDFIKEKNELYSIPRLCDSLKKSYYGEEAPLAKYSKEEIKKVADALVKVGLLNIVELKGTYGRFDTYGYNRYSTGYDLYFDDYKRKDQEIIKNLKEGKHIYPKEAEQTLILIKNGKIKEKNMDCIFSLFKYHEFVITHNEEIIKVFSGLSKNVKMYIPFIFDEYPEKSIEQKTLKKIAKSK